MAKLSKAAVVLTAFLVVLFVKAEGGVIGFDWEQFRDFLTHIIRPDPCNQHVIAYYKFDQSLRDVCNGYNGRIGRGFDPLTDISRITNDGASLTLDGDRKVSVPDLNCYEWGSQFSVSIWFKPQYSYVKVQGLINNDPVNNGSWGIQIALSENDFIVQAVLATSYSNKTFKNIATVASQHWHHVVMTYDGKTVKFYLNSHLKLTDSECCRGNIASQNSDVVIGYTKYKYDYYGYEELQDAYFNGCIDETKLFKKALTPYEVLKLYRLEVV